TASVYRGTVAQVQRLVDGLDAETAPAWGCEIAPCDVPSFEAWALPHRSASMPLRPGYLGVVHLGAAAARPTTVCGARGGAASGQPPFHIQETPDPPGRYAALPNIGCSAQRHIAGVSRSTPRP